MHVNLPSPLERCNYDFGCETYVKRDDLIHPEVSGNKYRKLRDIIDLARTTGKKGILTFGGAFSNHIYAAAAYSDMLGMKSVGIIRGEEDKDNPTMIFARSKGMTLHFVSRDDYRWKEASPGVQKIVSSYPQYGIIPEGGDHVLALPGLGEIVHEIKSTGLIPDYIALSSGTGITAAGILKAIIEHGWTTKVLVLSALKNKLLGTAILTKANAQAYSNQLIYLDEYCFGGYAKVSKELIDFMHIFYNKTHIKLDPVYTGKLVYGLHKLSNNNYFKPVEKLIWLHTGGLQGIQGYNYVLEKKGNKADLMISY